MIGIFLNNSFLLIMLCTDVISATSVSILDALVIGHPGHIVTYIVLYLEVAFSTCAVLSSDFHRSLLHMIVHILAVFWSENYSLSLVRHKVSPYSQYCLYMQLPEVLGEFHK